MQARKWKLDTDYKYLVKWWEQHEFGKVPKECLPPDGIIIEVNNVPVCAGGLYLGVGTKFGFMEWLIVDKKLGVKTAHKALNLCIENILKIARENKVRLVYTVTSEKSLQKRYVKYHGMEVAEKSATTFMKDLTGEKYNDLEWITDEQD